MDIKTVHSKLVFLANGVIETNVFYGVSKEDKINFYSIAGEAVEKQISKKPIEQPYSEDEFDSGTDYLCPECKSLVGGYSDDMEEWISKKKHCEDCGQKIDWSVENE